MMERYEPTAEDLAGLPLIVSVDDHVCEPGTLWQERLPAQHRARGPRLEREKWPSLRKPGTEVWADVWYYEDERVPMQHGYASVGKPPNEFDLEPLTFDDMRPGVYQVDARLADMDTDGVEAAVCFPNNFPRFAGQRFLDADDKELALLCVRAYNDWMIEDWCGPSDGRLIPSPILPLWDVDLAVQEVERNAARGATAVCFSEIPARIGLPSMHCGYWEPLFAACAETGTVINLHIGSSSKVHTTSDDAPLSVRVGNHFGNCSFSLSDWLTSGAFLRHPDLKIAFSEGQAGWVPFLLSRLDGFWRTGSAVAGFTLPEAPSSYLRDHVWFCIFDDPAITRFLDLIPVDNLCFETDYPHPDGSWPNSRHAALAQTGSLTGEQREKILRTNAANLYRVKRVLDAERLARV